MTARLYKSVGDAGARVSYRCPWCDVIGVAEPSGHHASPAAFWLLVGCADPACGRAALVRVPRPAGAAWPQVDAGGDGMLLASACVHPSPQPAYAEDGVPSTIARAVTESLRCQAAGLLHAATLVARHALHVAVRDAGGTGRDLRAALRSLPASTLDPKLRACAGDIELLAGDLDAPRAADVEALLVFTHEVLHNLYVAQSRLARVR